VAEWRRYGLRKLSLDREICQVTALKLRKPKSGNSMAILSQADEMGVLKITYNSKLKTNRRCRDPTELPNVKTSKGRSNSQSLAGDHKAVAKLQEDENPLTVKVVRVQVPLPPLPNLC